MLCMYIKKLYISSVNASVEFHLHSYKCESNSYLRNKLIRFYISYDLFKQTNNTPHNKNGSVEFHLHSYKCKRNLLVKK
jgi:hypothetical protein